MRIVIYIVILLSLTFAPIKPLDLANLEPVQTVSVRCEQNKIILETDTENRGEGETVAEAVADLKKKSPGVIYLDTAQYLLITKETAHYIEDLGNYLKDRVLVCLCDGQGSTKMADKYLSVKDDLPTLKSLRTNGKINFEKS